MTTEAKKSLRAAGAVIACMAAIAVGAVMRDRVELSGESDQLDLTKLVASASDSTELPENAFFEDIMELLKRKYVDPITDDTKLADGAVRGMVASLGDPNSLYMDPDQYRVYSNVREGKYEGIGADVVMERDRPGGKVQLSGDDGSETRLPKLVIAAIVPGSSADKAGLKPGDWAEFVDDHWVPNSEAFDAFDDLYQKVKDKKADPNAFLQMRKQLRDEADKRILAIKARDRLMIGTGGLVNTTWVRNGKRIQANLAKGEWQMPGFGVGTDGAIRVPFVKGAASELEKALSGKREATIDLRSNVEGDFDSMLECLKLVAPDGLYGYIVTRKSEKPTTLTIANGPAKPLKLTLLVDKTTRGAAEIFAIALSARGLAKLQGGEMAGNHYVSRWYTLPDGAGYSLVTGEFTTTAPKGAIAERNKADDAVAMRQDKTGGESK